MANALYTLARQSFLNGEIDWTDNDIKCVLVDTADYTVNISTDQYFDDIPSAAVVATSSNFSTKTTTNGVADADDVVFSSVSSTEDPCEALVIYQDTGTPGTSRLIAYIDTATGLPVTPNDADITVTWDSGANKIFSL